MNRILIVEDDTSISNVIDISLRNAGYLCDCVYDGMSVADQLEKENYDLALVDIMLPGPDGFSLMEYFNYYHVPVIFLTAMGDVQDKVKGLKLGAEDYMVKPFEIIELLAPAHARGFSAMPAYASGSSRRSAPVHPHQANPASRCFPSARQLR